MAALEDQAALGDDGVDALFAGQGRIFDNAVKRLLAGSSEDREGRHFGAKIHGIVAPFALGYVLAVEVQDQVELFTIKGDLQGWTEPLGTGRWLAPGKWKRNYGFSVTQATFLLRND